MPMFLIVDVGGYQANTGPYRDAQPLNPDTENWH